MLSPYINTTFKTYVYLRPDQLNNDIYNNLKNNLIFDLENKCFKDYGFIVKIYSIIDYSDGKVMSDNSYSPIAYEVTFSCKLCYPIKNNQLICKIERITEELIRLENGPIKVFVTSDRINKNMFYIDNNSNIRLKDKSKKLSNSDFVKVTISSIIFNNRDINITALGIIDNLATDDEIKNYYDNLYSK